MMKIVVLGLYGLISFLRELDALSFCQLTLYDEE